jgi:hypothetical protein
MNAQHIEWKQGEKHPCRVFAGQITIWTCRPEDEGSELKEEIDLAAQIVRDHNCHDDLLATLSLLKREVESEHTGRRKGCTICAVLDIASNIIAKATK